MNWDMGILGHQTWYQQLYFPMILLRLVDYVHYQVSLSELVLMPNSLDHHLMCIRDKHPFLMTRHCLVVVKGWLALLPVQLLIVINLLFLIAVLVTPVFIAAVPVTDQPTSEVSRGPPDSKYGKANLNALRNRLQYLKEITQTVVHTAGGAGPHSESTSNYVNTEIPYQTTKLVARKILTSLRNELEKIKEEREKALTACNVNKKAGDYYHLSKFSQHTSENPT